MEFGESEESRCEISPEMDAEVEAVGDVISNSERSEEDDEVSSDEDEYDDVIDTSTFKRATYPAVGNQGSNQTTPAGKQGDADGLKATKPSGKGKTVLPPAKGDSHDSDTDSNPGTVQQQQSCGMPSYHMQKQLGVGESIARLFFDKVLKGDIEAVKKQENRIGFDVQYQIDGELQ